jgi:hypothetical protein
MACAPCLSMVLSRMFEPLPLPKGSKTCSSSSDLGLCLSFGFRSLVGVSFSSFFSFLFLFGYQILCVVNALVKGGLRTMCGSRTDGWSLPGLVQGTR